jgi:hypothetical protein
MPHTIETATSARAKCRGCDQKIDKDQLRFGERQPNAFGDGEMTLWFHLRCGAYKRPEPFLETAAGSGVPEAVALIPAAEYGVEHRRLPRISGAERAPTGRARCRNCKEPIEQGRWRLPLTFFEEFRFSASGFVHAECAAQYFGTIDLLDRATHFSPALAPADLDDLGSALRAGVGCGTIAPADAAPGDSDS